MATFSTNHMDLVEAYKREGFTSADALLGALLQNNDLLRTAAILPSSHNSYHETLVADKLGSGSFRGAYEAIQQTNSITHKISEPIVSYEAESEVDELIFKGADNPAQVRFTEDLMNMQGITNGYNDALLYTVPSKTTENFAGLASRRKAIGTYCYNCGGSTSGSLTSAWLIEMGETAFSMRYAKGTMPGLSHEDMGRQKCTPASGSGHYWGWVTKFSIAFGIAVRQENALQRFANIDPTATSVTGLFENVIKAKNKLPNKGRNAFLYVNSDVQSIIEIMIMNKALNTQYVDIENYGPVAHFLGIPILPMDAIKSTETKLS